MKAILVSLAFLAAVANMRAAEAQPSAKLSDFKLGAYITGPQLTLESATGKAVLIDAWGIHCGPCLASLPDMEKISKRFKDKMLVFGAHSQDGTDDEVKDVVKKNKLSYTIVNRVESPISFTGIPRVFVFDTTGQLVFTGSPFDKEFEHSLSKATKGASAGPASASGGPTIPGSYNTGGSTTGAKPSGLDALKRPGT